jgi:hypothetical protein
VADIRKRLRAIRHTITAPRGGTDDPAGDDSLLGAAAAEIVALRARLAEIPLPQTTVRFSGPDSAVFNLTATPANATQHSVYVPLPLDMPPGHYDIAVSNGLGGQHAFVPLGSFVAPQQPHVTGITVAQPTPWPQGVWSITKNTMPLQPPTPTSDADLQAALDAAAVAGGGTIQFGRGQFFLNGPIAVPPNTRIVGEGMGLTGLYFSEASNTSAPPFYIYLDETKLPSNTSTAAWGLEDLTIFITAYHNTVIAVALSTNGFTMRRVRARVNAFFGQNNYFQVTRGRALNTSDWQASPQSVVLTIEACACFQACRIWDP